MSKPPSIQAKEYAEKMTQAYISLPTPPTVESLTRAFEYAFLAGFTSAQAESSDCDDET